MVFGQNRRSAEVSLAFYDADRPSGNGLPVLIANFQVQSVAVVAQPSGKDGRGSILARPGCRFGFGDEPLEDCGRLFLCYGTRSYEEHAQQCAS